MNETNLKKSNKIIGIDLGTTNSCVAIMENGKTRVIENKEGMRTIPSVVSFKPDGEILVGKSAKARSITDAENTVISVKRKMGEKDFSYNIRGKKYTPQQISAIILGNLVGFASEKLGEGKIERVVITVPAYFNNEQREATKDAGTIAGLKVERIINEPTAAALAYGLEKKLQKDQKVLVYDLGGGTFDVSILTLSPGGIFEVISTNGINDLGGDDYDQKLVNLFVEKFEKLEGINLTKEGNKVSLQRLREKAEEAKHDLSGSLQAEIHLPFIASKENVPLNLQLTVTRAEFEKITKDLTEKTIVKVRETLKDAKLKSSDINEILLVGGSTRMPIISEVLQKELNKAPNKEVNPDEVVAIGAAIQAGVLMGDVKDVLLLDVTPLSLGIETENGANTIMIKRNTTIPTSYKQIFSTAVDYQDKVYIQIAQGERPLFRDNKFLGGFELQIKNPKKRGIPQIEIEFAIDANGMISVSATDKETNEKQSITIKEGQGLSKEEINRMIQEAEENKIKDEEIKNNFEILNRAQAYLYTFSQQIEEFKKHKNFKEDDQQFQDFQNLYNDLDKATKEKNYPEIKKGLDKIEELMKLSNELMQKMPKEEPEKEPTGEKETVDIKPENEDKK